MTTPRRAARGFVASLVLAALLPLSRARADEDDVCIAAHERGQRLRKSAELRAARQLLVSCARPTCPAIAQVDCATWLAEVDRELPTIIASARGPTGEELVDVHVEIDGDPRAQRLDGKPLDVDPGAHVVRLSHARHGAMEKTIVVKTGERNRVVSVRLGEPVDPGTPWRIASLTAGGIGLAAGVVFAIFAIRGKSQWDDLQATCAPTRTCSESQQAEVERKFLIADIALAAGIVSFVASGVFLGIGTAKSASASADLSSAASVPPPFVLGLGVHGGASF